MDEITIAGCRLSANPLRSERGLSLFTRTCLMMAVLLGSVASPAASQYSSPRIARIQDLSYANVVRLNVRVTLPQRYTRPQVEALARTLVDSLSGLRRVNAISVMFFGPGTPTDGAWDVAAVDWAPGGRWEDAGTVQAGEYRTFRYAVNYREAAARPSTSESLASSGRRGLFGAPVPRGASLLSRTAGNAREGRDPSERYRIRASASAIADFYSRELPRLGWSADGSTGDNMLYFKKGAVMLGVIINRSGGTFTLMGS